MWTTPPTPLHLPPAGNFCPGTERLCTTHRQGLILPGMGLPHTLERNKGLRTFRCPQASVDLGDFKFKLKKPSLTRFLCHPRWDSQGGIDPQIPRLETL